MAETGGDGDGDGALDHPLNFSSIIDDHGGDGLADHDAEEEEAGLVMEENKCQIQEDGRPTDSDNNNHDAGGFSSVRNAAYSDDEEANRRRERGERFSDADCLHFYHLPEDVSVENLVTLLSEAGTIKIGRAGDPMVKIFKSQKPGESEAEVILEDPKSSKAMITWFNGYEYHGNKIEVTLDRKRSRSPSPTSVPKVEDGSNRRGGNNRQQFRGGRGRPKYDTFFPPSGYGRGFRPGLGGRGRGFHDFQPESFGRNNPNITPREGDWICPDPSCGNVNFARRTSCNKCNRPRKELLDSGFRGPPPPFLDHPPPVLDRGFGPPPGGLWDRVPFDDYGPPDHHHFPERHFHHHQPRDFRRESFDRYDDRDRYEKPLPFERGFERGFYRDRERDYYPEQRGGVYRDERRPPSPYHHRMGRDFRERSRSPVRRIVTPTGDPRYKSSDWPHNNQQFDHHSSSSRERRGDARRDQRNGLRR